MQQHKKHRLSPSRIRVSVVIPVYNDQHFLDKCLQSLMRQTRLPDEVIVVDNNCTDDSAKIASGYKFVTIIDEPTQGICAATKTGLDHAAANSDIVLRCDADSRPAVDWIEKVTTKFQYDNQLQAITGPGIFYDAPFYIRWLVDQVYMKAYFWSVGLALGQKPLFGSNFAMKSELWMKISHQNHLHQQDIHDDIDISYHVAQYTEIHFDDRLAMPISARPFKSLKSFLKRYPMGLRSITIHWPDQAPWRRFTGRR